MASYVKKLTVYTDDVKLLKDHAQFKTTLLLKGLESHGYSIKV